MADVKKLFNGGDGQARVYPTDTKYTIKLRDGIDRQIRFSTGAMKAVKTKLKKSVLRGEVFAALDEDLFSEVLFLVIVPEDRTDLKGPADIDELLDAPLMLYLMQQLGIAFNGAAPKNEDGQEMNSLATTATLQ